MLREKSKELPAAESNDVVQALAKVQESIIASIPKRARTTKIVQEQVGTIVQEQLRHVVQGQARSIVQHEVKIIVREEVRSIVQEEVKSIVHEEVKSIVQDQVTAILEQQLASIQVSASPSPSYAEVARTPPDSNPVYPFHEHDSLDHD